MQLNPSADSLLCNSDSINFECFQVHFQSPSSSPLHTHPFQMWILIFCLIMYCSPLGCYTNLAFILASMASALLISIFVSTPLLVFILWFILLFLYFARKVEIIKKCEKTVVSYVSNLWKLITESIKVPITISP